MDNSEKSQLKKLEENQDMLRFAIEAAELGTWDLDPKTNRFSGNERLKDWFGLSEDAEIDLSLALNVIAEKDRKRVADAIKYAMTFESGGEYDIEYTLIHPETHIERIVRAKGKATFGEDQKVLRLNGILQDITEQVIAGRKVSESESYFRVMADAVPVIVWMSDVELQYTYLNKNWQAYTGLALESSLGNGWLDAVHPEDIAQFYSVFADANANGRPFMANYKLRDFKGNFRWVNLSGSPRFDAEGIYEGMIGTVVDVHEQMEAEETVRLNEERLKLLIDESPMRITLLTGPDHVIQIANEQILQSWGKDKDIIGKPIVEVMPEIKDQPFLQILQEIYETGIPYSAKAAEAYFVVDGVASTFYFDMWYKPLFDCSKNVYAILTTAVDVTEKVKAEQKRDELERRFRMLIEETSVATCLFTGEDMVVEIANDIMIDIWGKGKSVIGKPFIEGVPELKGQPFIGILEEVRKTGIPFIAYDMPADLVIDGRLQTFYFDFTYKPIYDSDGEMIGIIDTAIDVTEKVLNRRKLEASEERFKSLIEVAPVAIALFVGADFVVEMSNQAFVSILGKGDVKGVSALEIESELINASVLKKVYDTGEMFQAFGVMAKIEQNDMISHNYYDFTYSPVFDSDGEVRAVLNIAVDVTENILALKRIEAAEEKTRLAIESADLGQYETNLHTGEMKTSERFNEIWGIEKTINREQLAESIHPQDLDIRQKAHEASLVSGYLDYEARILHPDASERWVRVKGRVIYDDGNNADSLIGVVQDITGQKQFADELTRQVKEQTVELQRSNDDLLQFAHVASHDLKEPVRKIKIFSNMLENEIKKEVPEKAQVYLDKIQNSTDRMFSMVEGVLAYSAVTSSERPIDLIDLNEVIENIESDLEILIQKKKAVIQKGQLPLIEGASVLIYQLFYNLINNALKFAKTEGTPLITIQPALVGGHDHKMAKIVVTDNGIGLDPEYVHKIFDVFSRLNAKDEYEGTGLGLALCKKIVQRHHGTIQASGVKGESAIFTILLPIKQAHRIL